MVRDRVQKTVEGAGQITQRPLLRQGFCLDLILSDEKLMKGFEHVVW